MGGKAHAAEDVSALLSPVDRCGRRNNAHVGYLITCHQAAECPDSALGKPKGRLRDSARVRAVPRNVGDGRLVKSGARFCGYGAWKERLLQLLRLWRQ